MRLFPLLFLLACAKRVDWVEQVRFVHGSAGPWALAGYRIGDHALRKFGITRDDAFKLRITHRSPKRVQYTCMMDGLMAATGVSPGKMNITHEPVEDEAQLETLVTYEGKTVRYTLVDAFKAKIKTIDYADFPKAVDFVKALPDDMVLAASK